MKILVVFTGGTIGSQSANDFINVVAGHTRLLLAQYNELKPESDVSFEVVEPLSILSENATPADWDQIVAAILQQDLSGFSGIIVTHGTDTLSPVSAALSFALSASPVPIVVVSSNQPLDEAGANGLQNFVDATSVIAMGMQPGVYVTYCNPDGRRFVHQGARLQNATPLDHYFRSIARSETGEFTSDGFVPSRTIESIASHALEWMPGSYERASHSVVLIHPYPGLDYTRYSLNGVKAVVHDLYHSGTGCTTPDDPRFSLMDFAIRVREAGAVLYLAPWPAASTLYESAKNFHDAGAVGLAGVSATAGYVKVLLGVGAGLRGERLTELVASTAVAGELAGPE